MPCCFLVLPDSVKVELSIRCCFSWYKMCKNRWRNARVIVENKVAGFLWLTVYMSLRQRLILI